MSQNQVLANYHSAIAEFHRYLKEQGRFPHPDQYPVLRAFFDENRKVIQSQWGRSGGKTTAALYVAGRFAGTNPGSETYIICPEIKQAMKIYWIPKRLQRCVPPHWIHKIWESDPHRIELKNGSTIMLDGCNNYEALRGIKPNLVIYDEFQHHSQEFDEEVMQPNLSSGQTKLVVFGTPPKRHCYYVDFRANVVEKTQEGHPKYFYTELPSWVNPTLEKEWFAEKKADLIKRKKYNVWLREYEGKLVFDTESAIFPFFDDRHIYSYGDILNLIGRDIHKMTWLNLFDPGTTSCFGSLFIGYHPYTDQVFVMDEIYAKEKSLMNSRAIWSTATAMRKSIFNREDKWLNIYDEAAAWFQSELPEAGLIPTHKQKSNIGKLADEGRAGESALNSYMLAENKFFVSDRCKNLIWEIRNYVFDENGKYPRKHDHLVDLLFYLVNSPYVTFHEQPDPDLQPNQPRGPLGLRDSIIAHQRSQDLVVEPDVYDTDEIDELWMN